MDIYDNSDEVKVILNLSLFIGVTLLLIGRGSSALSRGMMASKAQRMQNERQFQSDMRVADPHRYRREAIARYHSNYH